MKIVSFEVAKALKEAGYPQEGDWWYSQDGDDLSDCLMPNYQEFYAPTYLDAWLWLWREKKKWIDIIYSLDEDGWTFGQNPSPCDCGLYSDPEEAIEAAIDYIVASKRLK